MRVRGLMWLHCSGFTARRTGFIRERIPLLPARRTRGGAFCLMHAGGFAIQDPAGRGSRDALPGAAGVEG